MSYSLSIPATRKNELTNAWTEALAAYVEGVIKWQPTEEVADHLAAEVVGRPEDSLVVSISGHANPGHGPQAGYAPECVTISLSVIEAAAEQDAAA